MSSSKRRHSLDKTAKGDGGPPPNLLRKRPRLSPVKDLKKDGKFLKSRVIEDDYRKHVSAPTQLFRPHGQLDSVSAQARQSNRIEQRPPQVSTLFSPNSAPYSGPPELFDVSPSLPDVIHPIDGERSSWKMEHASFIKSAAGLSGSHWIGKRPLGSGGFGTAGLWERRDENNVVIEVM